MSYTKAPEWTGDIVRDMHLNNISIGSLADRVGITREWAGKVLHGQRTPAGAEEKFRRAVEEIIRERDSHEVT